MGSKRCKLVVRVYLINQHDKPVNEKEKHDDDKCTADKAETFADDGIDEIGLAFRNVYFQIVNARSEDFS